MAVTTAAVVGIGTGLASAGMSFSNAAKQKRAQKKAEQDAANMMKQARRRAEIDYYEGLNVPLDAFEAEREANIAADMQAVQALQEGDARSLAAGVGRIGAQQATEAEKTRIAMADEMFNLDKMKADSKQQINQQLIGMDVGQARDAQMRARDAEEARAAMLQQGIQGIGQAAGSAASLEPLYKQSQADKKIAGFANQKPANMSDAEWVKILDSQDFTRKQNSKNMFWDGSMFQQGSFAGDPGAYTGDDWSIQ